MGGTSSPLSIQDFLPFNFALLTTDFLAKEIWESNVFSKPFQFEHVRIQPCIFRFGNRPLAYSE